MGSSVKRKTRTQYNIRMAKDSHISLAVVFDVPEGQDASPYKAKFYAKSKAGTKECLYYGFGTLGNKVMCREGYKSAAGFLAHVNEIKDELEGLIKQVGKERVKILCSGTKGDLENIKSHMDGRLTIKYLELDSGALMLNPLPSGCAAPTSPSSQSLLFLMVAWMSSRLGLRSFTMPLRMDLEPLECITMASLLLVIVCTAEKDTRMLKLL